MNDILHPSNSTLYGKEPQYNKKIPYWLIDDHSQFNEVQCL